MSWDGLQEAVAEWRPPPAWPHRVDAEQVLSALACDDLSAIGNRWEAEGFNEIAMAVVAPAYAEMSEPEMRRAERITGWR